MMANVLPGFRELRAPLAAGYVWLLALWLLLNSRIPDPDSAGGILAPIYRVAGLFTAIGWAIALSMAAYLVGSLSTLVFGSLVRPALEPKLAERRFLDPLTPRTRRALRATATTRHARLEALLTFTDAQVEDVLEEVSDTHHADWPSKIYRARPDRQRRRGPGYARPDDDPRASQVTQIEAMILGDLEIVASTRLLGEQPDLFGAVDRGRAEVEFRVALVVPLLALATAAATRATWPGAALWVLGGLAVSAGLLLDALRQQRLALGLLIDLVVTDRVQVPSLERSESKARQAAESDFSDARQVSEQVDAALRAAFKALASVGTSEPALALESQRLAKAARVAADNFTDLYPDDSPFLALEATVSDLELAADGWVAYNEGKPADVPLRDLTSRARRSWLNFLQQVRRSLAEGLSEVTERHDPPTQIPQQRTAS